MHSLLLTHGKRKAVALPEKKRKFYVRRNENVVRTFNKLNKVYYIVD